MKKNWAAALVVYVLATIAFPLRTEWLNREFKGVFSAPDSSQGYDATSLAKTFGGAAGPDRWRRIWYARTELSLDVLFPCAYVALFCWVLLAIYPGSHRGAGRWWKSLAIGVPVAMGAADLAENAMLFVIARLDRFDLQPLAIEDNAKAIAGKAAWAHRATSAKFLLLAGVLGLLVWALWRSERLGRFVTLAWLGRVPILGLVSLLVFAALGGADQTSPTIPNMLALDSPVRILAVGFLASVAAMLAGFSLVQIWELGALRARSRMPDLPAPLSSSPDPGRNAIFLFFALPFVVRTVVHSGSGVLDWLAALTGMAASILLLRVVDRFRSGVAAVRIGWLTRFLRWLADLLGPGYANPAAPGFLPGHGMATSFAAVMGLLYAVAWWLLSPGNKVSLTDSVPTAGYLLALIAILVSLLSGATFFFDRWRLPLIGVLVAWVSCVNLMHPMMHEFESRWDDKALPSAAEALAARFPPSPASEAGAAPQRILTVVTASGGGIQAAAWTARVLTGLQETLHADFTRSIGLVSAVSGGSVGAYFALTAFGDDGAMRSGALDGVREASRASALEETAWGILFPDLQRGLQPLGLSTRDRGWALERGWLAAVREERLDEAHRYGTLSSWVEASRTGVFPAVIVNATRIDDGMPLRLTTVGPSVPLAPESEAGADAELLGLRLDFTYQLEEKRAGHLDLDAVTAARLSATFPYVSPIARPAGCQGKWWPCEDPEPKRLWHAADGGYFDNHGTVAALAWFRDVEKAWGPQLAERFDRLVWLQIDAFPEGDPATVDRGSDWTMSSLGPIQGLVQVRTASQRVRRVAETALLQRLPAPFVKIITLRPPKPDPFPHREAPLSWELSPADQARIDDDWRKVVAGPEVRELVSLFAGQR